MIVRCGYCVALLIAITSSPLPAVEIEVTVDAGKHDRANSIVAVPIELPESLADVVDAWPTKTIEGLTGPGQVTSCPLTSTAPAAKPGNVARMLYLGFVDLKAGEKKSATYMIDLEKNVPLGIQGKPRSKYDGWKDTNGKHNDLSRADVPVLRYMYEAIDTSSAARREETFKPYHHLYTPDGKQLATKGSGGKFPHHRGLFYGFNKITHNGKQQADTWHCNKGEWQAHNKVLASDAGHVLGRHRVAIDWHGRDGKVFAKEEREMTAFMMPTSTGGATLIEFASKLTAIGDTVHLDGDPQHAGFQFRASQEVPDKTAKLTYYIRPDGVGKPGKFRNWPGDKQHENLPWNALCFVLGDQRYTAVYADHPKNPKPARYSERDYGRFGSYFSHDVTTEAPLIVNYRLYLQAGELKVDDCALVSREFVEPIVATVK